MTIFVQINIISDILIDKSVLNSFMSVIVKSQLVLKCTC